jgi:ketosteroid isomerase-like protein
MKANDLEAVLKTYAPDAVVWLPEVKEARGEKEIRSAFEGLLSANTIKEVVLSETGYRTMGKVSVGWGRFSLTLAPKSGGSPVVMVGRYTDIAERRGGRWVYVVDHASAEPAGTEGPKK